ncbi:MAG TPA: hypothetical protein VNV66_19085 [Pilimelia sp.]|nr:hypothetical protein [Pilimelia sp.]
MTVRRPQMVVTAAVVVAVVAATLSVWAVASRARTPAQRAAEAAPPSPSDLTAVVEKGPLTDAFTLDGKLRRRARSVIHGPTLSEGKSVVTDLPVKRGKRVNNRQVVAVVSGRPLIALKGRFPSYRDLHLGDEGPDVRQLRRALGLWDDDVYDRATAAGVVRLYQEAGYPLPAGAADPASATPNPSRPGTAVRGGLLPMNEVVFLPTLPATVVEVTAAIGDKGDQPLLTVASAGWQVVATVNEEERADLRDLPTGTSMSIGDEPAGRKRVTLVGIKEVKSTEQDETSYEATFAIAASSEEEGLTEGLPMSVRVVRQQSPDKAVIVPVSALWTKPGGQTEVRVRSADSITTVPVNVLFVVDGRAAVTGPAELTAGVRVAVGSRNGGPIG